MRNVTLSGQPYFDAEGAVRICGTTSCRLLPRLQTIPVRRTPMGGHTTIQMLPFQFSLHRLDASGELTHSSFLDLSGNDPSEAFAATLVRDCSEPLPVFVYHAGSRVYG